MILGHWATVDTVNEERGRGGGRRVPVCGVMLHKDSTVVSYSYRVGQNKASLIIFVTSLSTASQFS